MTKRLIDLMRLVLPIARNKKALVLKLEEFLQSGDIREIKSLIKKKKVDISETSLKVSPQVCQDRTYPAVSAMTEDKDIVTYINNINKMINEKVRKSAFEQFSKKAHTLIPKLIAMNIVGMEQVKIATAIQLFARFDEPVHILLLGDPSTGKTDILRSASNLHPISSFGLGSGTSGVGLTVTLKGDEVSKGLLPMADKGLCAIDELNLMQDRDRASLYNAMEKGFLTYDKGGKHYKFDARVRVLSTANPKGDKFVGWTIETLKKQMPFDTALLSRFHLVFMIRQPDIEKFVEISKKIIRNDKKKVVSGDEKFIQDYVSYADRIDVEIPVTLEKEIVDFISEIKKQEKKYLIDISPRLVLGFVRLAKASARMKLSKNVNQDDIDLVMDIVTRGLQVR